MGLNLSNRQIAQELDLNEDDVQAMTEAVAFRPCRQDPGREAGGLRSRSMRSTSSPGTKEIRSAVAKKDRAGRRRRLKRTPGRGTLEKEKSPILGLIQRGGEVVLHMLANVQQTTIRPIIEGVVAPGSRILDTDEYSIYARLKSWGYEHKTVCHGRGEYARDEDGNGFCEVHVNTLEVRRCGAD